VRVFLAPSLDGFIGGPNDDLRWLPQPSAENEDHGGFGAFLTEVGARLMGRRSERSRHCERSLRSNTKTSLWLSLDFVWGRAVARREP
jgi:hypothetical protein